MHDRAGIFEKEFLYSEIGPKWTHNGQKVGFFEVNEKSGHQF